MVTLTHKITHVTSSVTVANISRELGTIYRNYQQSLIRNLFIPSTVLLFSIPIAKISIQSLASMIFYYETLQCVC